MLQHPNATAVAPIEMFDPPTRLRGRARLVWEEFAPRAFEKRTLTRATEGYFEMGCRNVVLERRMAVARRGAGGANHRGMIQRVTTWLKDFDLAPFGKPLYAAQPVAATNPLDRFTKKAGA